MLKLLRYIEQVLGMKVRIEPLPEYSLHQLPLYIKEAYELYSCNLYHQELVLAELKDGNEFSNLQIEKHLDIISNIFHQKAALITYSMTAINRKRLIEKGINFIVPEKQLFLPDMMLDLRERFGSEARKTKHTLLPSAQLILLFHILHRQDDPITDLSFKQIAEKLGYTQMAVSKAAEDLRLHELCEVRGTKEKYMDFTADIPKLWQKAMPHLVNPVLKKVFVDQRQKEFKLHSNISALSEYSNINYPRQAYYAVERNIYYGLQKSRMLVNENKQEGAYCVEVWKYEPEKLIKEVNHQNVDPLSLYLSLRDMQDERIEMALEEIINTYI